MLKIPTIIKWVFFNCYSYNPNPLAKLLGGGSLYPALGLPLTFLMKFLMSLILRKKEKKKSDLDVILSFCCSF